MNDALMVYPMAALVLLTAICAVVMLRRRIAAARARTVHLDSFKTNQFDENAPALMLQAGRHFANLFETPVLFYAVCVSTMALNFTDSVMLILAWLYVAARLLHSTIHMNANKVIHRLQAFGLSCTLLLAMWVYLVLRAAGLV